MSETAQTLAAAAVILITLVCFAWRMARNKRGGGGCSGGCGCGSKSKHPPH
ncbi:MAG: hypothetical protein KA004_09210 [Verrucomicrobiales bacterium]|nr:hypothetical protein [Verrucomicrobiales bacterium]